MRMLTYLHARGLSAVLAISLLSLAASPAVALAGATPECSSPYADAAGLRDSAGRLREPLATRAAGEVPDPSQHSGSASASFKATVKVYFHVITERTEGAVSATTISKQLAVMNKGFAGQYGGANSGFKFTLGGVDTTRNAGWFDAGPGSAAEAAMKKALKRGGPTDMNVYTTSGNLYLGWAYFPSIVGSPQEYLDGVVIDYRSLPGGPYGSAYSLGGTLTHESGHWFGLYHTFDGKCGAKGDFVADTPAERTPTSGCPVGKDTCTQPGFDPIHNYMDYSYDSCYTQFTPGQASRMQDQYLFFRV